MLDKSPYSQNRYLFNIVFNVKANKTKNQESVGFCEQKQI